MFDSSEPPAQRKSTTLGCLLQPVVRVPEGSENTKRVVWTAKEPNGQLARVAPAASPLWDHQP